MYQSRNKKKRNEGNNESKLKQITDQIKKGGGSSGSSTEPQSDSEMEYVEIILDSDNYKSFNMDIIDVDTNRNESSHEQSVNEEEVIDPQYVERCLEQITD